MPSHLAQEISSAVFARSTHVRFEAHRVRWQASNCRNSQNTAPLGDFT
jgi:hypothetical protein